MTTQVFKQGDEVYDIHGRSGSYVARTAGGHIVEPMYEQEDDEPPHYGEASMFLNRFTKD